MDRIYTGGSSITAPYNLDKLTVRTALGQHVLPACRHCPLGLLML